MKTYLQVLLLFPFFIGNLLCAQDKNQAINDYLDSIIKNQNQEIIIIKEKISSDKTIEIFRGTVYLDPVTKKNVREFGVEKPLYSDKHWEIMKKRYNNRLPTDERKWWLRNTFWVATDFKRTQIIFIPQEEIRKRLENGTLHDPKNIREIYSFSDPIFYKKNKYIVFTVMPSRTDSISFFHEFIIIMQKVNNKWLIVNKTHSNVYY
jgi:hypothetical protein